MAKFMKVWDLVILVGFIAYVAGLAEASVGTMPTECSTPYPWYLPWLIGFLMIFPAILGYSIGRTSEQHSGGQQR